MKGTVSIKSINVRSYEDLDTHGFLLSATYLCGICGLTKSGTDSDAVSEMGLPSHLFRLCPVVFFKKSAWSAGIFLMINTMITGRLGASEIRMLLIKLRIANYVKRAAFYLELQIHKAKQRSTNPLESYGFIGAQNQVTKAQGFPGFTDHCGPPGFSTGFGGKMPPSAHQISEIFIVSSTNVKQFSYQLMASIGAEVMKVDHTHNGPHRILIKSEEGGESVRPTKGLMSGNNFFFYSFKYTN